MNDVTILRAEELIGAIRNGSPASRRESCRSATILLADGLAGNAGFSNVLADESYAFVRAETAQQVFQMLSRRPVDLVILSGAGATFTGLDCCRKIKANRRTELVPVLVVTDGGVESQIDALSAGAD